MDISIIVPLYKGNRYIKNILYMVNENYRVLVENGAKKNIEIILVNDYPDENIVSLNLLDFGNVSVQIYENAQNLGIHKSRVIGLEKAKGTFILFLDQDDEIKESYMWKQLEYLGKADAVICNGIYRNNRIIYKDFEQQKQVVSKNEYLSRGNTIISPGQVLIKRDKIPKTWMKHILQENGSDDVLLWTLMFSEGEKFAVNPSIEYQHREDGKNTSLNFVKMKKSVEELLAIVKREGLLKNKDLRLFIEMSKKRIEKYNGYIQLLENWNEILKNICILITQKIYKNIAIYGYGIIGKKLLQDLEKRNIKPYCVIDNTASNFTKVSYPLYKPEKIPKDVDLVILTPLFDEKNIKIFLNQYIPRANIISIDVFAGKSIK